MSSGSLSSKADVPGSSESEITVRVKFLAHFQEIFGGKERAVHLPSGSSVDQLLSHLCDTQKRRRELLIGRELNAQVVVLKNGVPARFVWDEFIRLLHDYKMVVVRGGVCAVGGQSLSEALHHPSSLREICIYRLAAFERGLDLRKMEPEKAKRW